jgi:uncharacterized protein YjbI with pentapeptide repeats
MANDEDLARIRQGVTVWNDWREHAPGHRADLSEANLSKAHFSGADLRGADLSEANFSATNLTWQMKRLGVSATNLLYGDLSEAMLRGADLNGVNLNGANLRGTNLSGVTFGSFANLDGVNFSGAMLNGANFSLAHLGGADLRGADLRGADLQTAILVNTNLTDADLTGCRIYGISAWDLELYGAKQRDLIITGYDQPEITVDNIEVGQFIHLLLHNEKIRDVIDTITSKAVLILGRFTDERKAVLDSLREDLRNRHYLPILFDFKKPDSKDLTGTMSTLAHMARFIIADLTDPSCIPYELATVLSNTFVPVQPILLSGKSEFAMLPDLRRRFHWVLATHHYDTQEHLTGCGRRARF